MDEDELILGRYRPLAQAGKGGYGTVVMAWDTRIQRRVAVKLIELEQPVGGSAAHDGYDSSIPGLEEARTAAMLTHPNIVGVLDFEAHGSTAYFIMEYMDGLTLTQLIKQYGPCLDLDVAAAVIGGVSRALQHAHENGVLHLDIKPDNIMINRQGQVKVADFGLSELAGAGGFGQAAGGTIGYMPPEQMRLEPLDARADEWALASVFYEMCAAGNPFWANDLDEAVRVIENAELVLPSLLVPGLDEQADDVLFYALDPDRSERYDSVADFADELLAYLGDEKAGTTTLAQLVDEATEDTYEAEERRLAAVPLIELVVPRVRTAAMRAWNAASAGVLAFVGLANTPQVGGFESLAFWGLLALVVLAGAAVPHIGALLASLAFAAALLTHGAYVPGALLVVGAVAWWYAAGRYGQAQPACALAPALLGSVGLGALTPLLCGYFLELRDSLATCVYAAFLAMLLAAMGTGQLDSWWLPAYWQHVGPGFTQSLVLVVSNPITWAHVVAWLLAALLVSLFCARRSPGLALCGMALGAAALAAALAAQAALGGYVSTPQALLLAGSVLVGLVLAALGVPGREEEIWE